MSSFCEDKLRRMTNDHPFLASFNKEVRRALITELENEIVDVDREVRKIRRNKEAYFEDKLKPEFKTQVIELKRRKRVLQEYLFYVKKIYYFNNRAIEESEPIIIKTLSNNQMVLLDYLLENGLKDNVLVKDLTDIYLYLLQEGKSELIKEIAITLADKFNKAEGDLKDYLYSLINSLKKQTKIYIRREAETRELLNYYIDCFKLQFDFKGNEYFGIVKAEYIKELERKSEQSLNYRCLLKECSDTLNVVNVLEEEEQHDYMLDIIDFWLNNEKSYIYLKRLVDLKPEIVNIKDDNGDSIIFTILNYYFTSCQTQLRNQKKGYIHKEYYSKVFKLFYTHPMFKLENEEKLQTLIEQFKLQIGKYKDSGTICKCLDELCKKDDQAQNLEPVDCNYLAYMYTASINKPRKIKTNDYNFAIVNHNAPYINRSYSVSKNDKGRYVISVHTVDMSEYIERDTPLDNYLKANMFEDSIPSAIIDDYISLDKSLERPTITYEIELLNNGRIGNSRIYKSITKLDDIFTYSDFEFPNSMVQNAYKTLLKSFELEETNIALGFEKMCLSKVSQAVGSYFSKRDLPFIYRVQRKKTSDDFIRNINGLNILMSKISKNDASIIYRIICEDHNSSFYDQENIGHFSSNQTYYLDLFNPIDSYITLTLQRLINEFYIYRDRYNIELWQQELIDVILKANNSKETIKDKQKTLRSE